MDNFTVFECFVTVYAKKKYIYYTPLYNCYRKKKFFDSLRSKETRVGGNDR